VKLNFFSRNKSNEITKTFDRSSAKTDTNKKRLAATLPDTTFNCEEDQNFDPNHIHIVVKKKERRVSAVE